MAPRPPVIFTGDDLPYTIKNNIYSMLNSDGNGFLLAEFEQVLPEQIVLSFKQKYIFKRKNDIRQHGILNGFS